MSPQKNTHDEQILNDSSQIVQNNVGDFPISMKNAQLSDMAAMQTSPHWNEGLEINYILSGSMIVNVNGEPNLVKENDIIMIAPGCIHYFTSHEGNNCKFQAAIFGKPLLYTSNALSEKYLDPLYHPTTPQYIILSTDHEKYAELIDLFRPIYHLIDKREKGYEIMLLSWFCQLIHFLYINFETTFFRQLPGTGKDELVFQSMLSFIHRNYAEHISVEDIAEIGHVSRKQCYNLFHKYAGKTPGECLMQYRLYMSRNLLRKKEIPISQIATMCGFAHQSHFTNHFSRFFGITPKKYRDS